ncbi:MAG: hypothetical protein JW751_13780 [Polyangiaceae bacterium]|nr:hypothetical protein [Polyangiaceae bacterium]
MRQVQFFALPRAIQERFLAATAGAAPPLPLAYKAMGRPPPIGWILSALVAGGALAAAVAYGYGDAKSPFALAPTYMMGVYAVAIWWLTFSALEVIGKVIQAGMVPFRRGVYLFPGGVIDARSSRIAVTRLDELSRSELLPQGAGIRLVFRRRTWEFPLFDRTQGPALVEALGVHQQKLRTALEANSQHDVALLDPLVDPGIHSPLTPTAPLQRRSPGILRHAAWVALLPALGLAWPVFTVRNSASERQLFVTAHAANTPDAYLAYLVAGGARPEVRDALLPRAELAAAQRTGSSEAVAKVVIAHGNTPVRPELEVALRAMLLAEIEAAKKQGSATAIRNLGKRLVRRDLVEGELAVALHDVYLEALERFKKQAPAGDDELVPFVKRLLSHAEKNGPRVEVRFRRALRPTVAATDDIIKKNPYYRGSSYLPSRYFTPERAAPRETAAFDRLKARFDHLFPKDIIEVVRGASIDDPTATYPTVTTPTVFFSHETYLGGAFATRGPPGVFAGVGIVFAVSFRLPNKPTTLDVQHSVWQVPDLARIQQERLEPEQVYELMATTAFERFSQKLQKRWFETP